VVLGRRAIVDVPSILILVGTYLVLVNSRKILEPLVILATGVIGLAVSYAR
jgi:hypothetical protein